MQCDYSTGLIVGGSKAQFGEFPHMAAIAYLNFDRELFYGCGGTLISERFVLTAAHCRSAERAKPILVRLGDLNLKTKGDTSTEISIRIKRFIVHPSYKKRTRENDIALIKLASAVTFSINVRPACLQQDNNFGVRKALVSE